MNLIENEIIQSKEYYFEMENDLVKISKRNISLAYAMINYSKYSKSFDTNIKGSSAYWFAKLNDLDLNAKNNSKDSNYIYLMKEFIKTINRENSTHLNADGVGLTDINDRILNYSFSQISNMLKSGNTRLIIEISKKTSSPTKARKNYSFATKFCHYFCYYKYKGKRQQDNYSIYDRIVDKALKKYLKYYKINTQYNFHCYEEFIKAIDLVIKKSKVKISRNGLDRLLWYYYKNKL